ncbi:MAG: transposase [Paramuribaculum sp.]|nr:transposase [Paramuribaculum sp.]
MSNTYSSVFIHIVFAVKNRENLLPTIWLSRIWAYISKMLLARGHKPIAIGGTQDHIHILINYKITEVIPDLVRDIKINSGKFISDNCHLKCRFAWQSGYGCFSYGASQVDIVRNYINNQDFHHRGKSLKEEIKMYLERCGIEFDEKYLFPDLE